MKWFTYKLYRKNGSGYSPKRDVSQDWLNCGFAANGDLFLGSTTKDRLEESFVPDDVSKDPLRDYEIRELTEEEALQFCRDAGFLEPKVSGTAIVDGDPPYVETRGKKYVQSLEAVVLAVQPEKVKSL